MIKVTQIRSSNRRPVNHKDFKGDVREEPEVFESEEAFLEWLREWGFMIITQGDRLEIERCYNGKPIR